MVILHERDQCLRNCEEILTLLSSEDSIERFRFFFLYASFYLFSFVLYVFPSLNGCCWQADLGARKSIGHRPKSRQGPRTRDFDEKTSPEGLRRVAGLRGTAECYASDTPVPTPLLLFLFRVARIGEIRVLA